MPYYSDKTNIFKDVLYHGCVSGTVSELIWYSDTVRFYKKYQEEINELLKDLMDGTGLYSMKELFGKNWDDEDPLAINDYNRNLLRKWLCGFVLFLPHCCNRNTWISVRNATVPIYNLCRDIPCRRYLF